MQRRFVLRIEFPAGRSGSVSSQLEKEIETYQTLALISLLTVGESYLSANLASDSHPSSSSCTHSSPPITAKKGLSSFADSARGTEPSTEAGVEGLGREKRSAKTAEWAMRVERGALRETGGSSEVVRVIRSDIGAVAEEGEVKKGRKEGGAKEREKRRRQEKTRVLPLARMRVRVQKSESLSSKPELHEAETQAGEEKTLSFDLTRVLLRPPSPSPSPLHSSTSTSSYSRSSSCSAPGSPPPPVSPSSRPDSCYDSCCARPTSTSTGTARQSGSGRGSVHGAW